MKHIDLFSGIGGFALASRWAGIETIAFCEKEPFCQQVLQKNFPGVPIYDDARTFSGLPYRGRPSIITGGYPCQPFSVAGKRKGQEDDRHLWPEMRRIIAEAQPDWVIAENVAGHITMGLDSVLSDLDALGYASIPIVVPACSVDAPHRRDRVWIVANRDNRQRNDPEEKIPPGRDAPDNGGFIMANADSIRKPQQAGSFEKSGDGTFNGSEIMGDSSIQPRNDATIEKPRENQGEWPGKAGGSSRAVSDSDGSGLQEQWGSVAAQQEYETTKRYCRWSAEPSVGRVVNGLSGRVDRIKSLGNAIVPQVAYEIFRSIREASQ